MDDIQAALAVIQRAASQAVNPLTVAELIDAYKPAARKNREWQTALGRMSHIVRILGNERVMELKASRIAHYRKVRSEEVSHSPATRGKPVTVATINREVATLKRACTWAAEEEQGLIPHSPIARLRQAPEDNVREVIYSDADIELMIRSCHKIGRAGPVLRALILTLRDGGLRISEARALELRQIDPETREVHLRARSTKTRKGRTTRLSERALDAIEAINWRGKRYVFQSTRGTVPHSYKYLATKFNELVKLLGLRGPNGEKPHRHDLRRTFTTQARRHGLPERVIMALTGHTTRKTFDRYNIVGSEDIQAAHRILDRHERRTERKPPKYPLRRDG